MKISPFTIIGIQVRTTNQGGQSGTDIRDLWVRLFDENIPQKIPNQLESAIYCVYTDYEGDFQQPYTTILGCKVPDDTEVPEGMVKVRVPGGNFSHFSAKGDLNAGVVFTTWAKIWKSDIKRAYTADFEVYGEKAQNPNDAEVDIYVATKRVS